MRSASSAAGQSLAHFSCTAVIVTAADGLASSIVTALIVQATSVVCTQGTAHFGEAGESLGAFTVLRARQRGRSHTANLGSGARHHSADARAGRPVVGNGAHGIWSTRILLTGIIAAVVPARLAGATILIRMAAEDALVTQANVSQEAVVVYAASYWKRSRRLLIY